MTAIAGIDQVQRELDRMRRDGVRIAAASVRAGVNVLVEAAVEAVPGQIKLEIGGYIRIRGTTVIGRAGLMVFPSKDGGLVRGLRPHGIYLEAGTRYIVARHWISSAMRTARPRAAAAMESAGQRKLKQLKGQ